jgi:hypothetical protein
MLGYPVSRLILPTQRWEYHQEKMYAVQVKPQNKETSVFRFSDCLSIMHSVEETNHRERNPRRKKKRQYNDPQIYKLPQPGNNQVS